MMPWEKWTAETLKMMDPDSLKRVAERVRAEFAHRGLELAEERVTPVVCGAFLPTEDAGVEATICKLPPHGSDTNHDWVKVELKRGPRLPDPDAMHGAADGFPGSDFEPQGPIPHPAPPSKPLADVLKELKERSPGEVAQDQVIGFATLARQYGWGGNNDSSLRSFFARRLELLKQMEHEPTAAAMVKRLTSDLALGVFRASARKLNFGMPEATLNKMVEAMKLTTSWIRTGDLMDDPDAVDAVRTLIARGWTPDMVMAGYELLDKRERGSSGRTS